jgi:uncharacterized protein
MKKILILSDTHSYLDTSIEKHASQHDEIWHAGDWGNLELYDKLLGLVPVRGVYGNIDGADIRIVCPKVQTFTCEQIQVYMTHIAGYPGRYGKEVKQDISRLKPNLVICGHSHILKVMFDKKLNHLHINPGAIGLSGFHQLRTMISMEIDGREMRNLKVIEFEK